MNYKLKFLFLGLLVLVWSQSFAQNEYYRVNGKNAVDKNQYLKLKEVYLKMGEIEEILLKSDIKKDSIVKYIKIGKVSKTPDGKDPYSEIKKFIGRKFPIEN